MTLYPKLEGLQLQVPALFPYVITSRFDEPRNYGHYPSKKQLHEGIDFAPTGRQDFLGVAPVLPGRVVKIGYDQRGYGEYVVLEHLYGDQVLFSWYAHLADIFVKEGDNVPLHWLLAEAGTTGLSSGVHVHFTLQYIPKGLRGYVVDYVIDPMPYFGKSHYAG